MSELIQNRNGHAAIRWNLLTGVSALALISYVSSTNPASAEDAEKPTVWIELGGQLNRLEDGQEAFSPPFVALTPSNFPSPLTAERSPGYGFEENGTVLIQPEGSAWHFSASVRYGRAESNKHVHHQTYPVGYQAMITGLLGTGVLQTVLPVAARFTDAKVKQSETHTILDFEVGKDVGLGIFGRNAASSLNVGVRFAQFTSKSRVTLAGDPDWRFDVQHYTKYYGYIGVQRVYQPYHSFTGNLEADRSFRGLGPALSWKSSAPLAGDMQHGELMLDWGVNAALLFGRQKAATHHQTTGRYHSEHASKLIQTTYQHPQTPDHTRSRGVVVPNVGGFAGLSFNYDVAKVSFGYRADFFFGAMDGGIDTRKTYDRNFYGPYASVSIGLGG